MKSYILFRTIHIHRGCKTTVNPKPSTYPASQVISLPASTISPIASAICTNIRPPSPLHYHPYNLPGQLSHLSTCQHYTSNSFRHPHQHTTPPPHPTINLLGHLSTCQYYMFNSFRHPHQHTTPLPTPLSPL